MKRLGIVLVILILMTAVVAFFVSRNQRRVASPPAAPTGIITTLPQPTFPEKSPLLPAPAYSVSLVTGTFPSIVATFQADANTAESVEASRLASVFRITATPTITNLLDGTFYVWSANPGLVVGPGSSHVDYSFTTTTTGPLTTPDSVFVDAGRVFVDAVSPNVSSKLASVLYFAPILTDLNYVSRDRATAIQLTFAPTLSGFPLITGSPATSYTTLRFGASKTLLYYSGYAYPGFTKTGEATIITLDQAKQRLLEGRGQLLSAFSPQDINAHDTKLYNFSLTSVHKAELAYYYNPTSGAVAPVFLFYGTATDATSGKNVDTVSIVSAVP